MLDLGMQELIVIFVVALLVFGPKKLPELGQTLGKGMRYMRRAMFEVKNEINKEFSDTHKAIDGMKDHLKGSMNLPDPKEMLFGDKQKESSSDKTSSEGKDTPFEPYEPDDKIKQASGAKDSPQSGDDQWDDSEIEGGEEPEETKKSPSDGTWEI